MKKIITFSITLLFIFSSSTFAQSRADIVGTYEQRAFSGPKEVQEAESDVLLKQDPQLSKVIWINNLIKGGRIKAVLNITGNGTGTFIYNIPAQIVGNYEIKFGCFVYGEEGQITIALNNKTACMGVGAGNMDNIKIGNGSINVGDIAINNDGNGSIKTPGVDIEKGNINVNSKLLNEGIQYVGNKEGTIKAASTVDNEKDSNEEVEIKTTPTKTKTKVKTTNSGTTVEVGDTKIDGNGNITTPGASIKSNGNIKAGGTTINNNGGVKTKRVSVKSKGAKK